MAITIEEAKNLKCGQVIYHATKKNADKTSMRAKVLSVKTWKRSPDRVLISLKHGMYDFAKFDETQLNELNLSD